MRVRKIGAGAVFVGAVISGMVGAGSASAAPGISYQNGSGNEIGLGDHGPGASADARAKGTNSQALAISLFSSAPKSPSFAKADGDGATAVSIDGYTSVTGSNTHGFAASGQTNVNGADNNVVTVGGNTYLYSHGKGNDVHGNFVVNFAGNVDQSKLQQVTDAGEVSVSLCDTSLTGQAAHIKATGNPSLCGGK
jgi:hypothetical protein